MKTFEVTYVFTCQNADWWKHRITEDKLKEEYDGSIEDWFKNIIENKSDSTYVKDSEGSERDNFNDEFESFSIIENDKVVANESHISIDEADGVVEDLLSSTKEKGDA